MAFDRVEESHPYDLVAHARGTKLFIHLAYDGRALPTIPETGKDCLLLVDLTFIGDGFKERNSSAELLTNLVIELFEADMQHKHWLYHPLFPDIIPKRRLTAEMVAPLEIKEPPKILPPTGKYNCLNCKKTWPGKQHQDAMCPTCRTPLYSRFTELKI